MSYVDLHIHSNSSDDGEFSPEELIAICRKHSMKRISVTDHNSVKSVSRAIEEGRESGIEVISGIEIDCVYSGRNFHLLGYFFDHTKRVFEEIEDNIIGQERAASRLKIAAIKKAINVEITEEEVFSRALNGIVTGELIGEILLNKPNAENNPLLAPYVNGERRDMPYVNFYWDYFSQGKVAYVPIKYPTLKEAIDIIHQTGGVCALAHPAQNLKGEFDLIDSIIDEGIDGIEVFSSYHDDKTADFFLNKACERNLIITCGSDFHGKNKPNITIGSCRLSISEDKIL
ncbi:MAG: PHP domain-containing protein [Clostridiales bacterium]|jgi:predicted metal-dependent phosphoesterase TrpH|nr:PHP domain-containing protein [Clostridiales bacterium]